jgi:hypothetical protein
MMFDCSNLPDEDVSGGLNHRISGAIPALSQWTPHESPKFNTWFKDGFTKSLDATAVRKIFFKLVLGFQERIQWQAFWELKLAGGKQYCRHSKVRGS